MKMLLAGRQPDDPADRTDDRKRLLGGEKREEWDVDKAAQEAVERAFEHRKKRQEKGSEKDRSDA